MKQKGNQTALIVLSVVAAVLAVCVVVGVIGGILTSDDDDAGEPNTQPSIELDEAGVFACTDFAKGYKAAQTKDARVELANKVNKWAASSKTDRIAELGAALGRAADSTPEEWTLAADTFAARCMDAGWNADTAK